MTFLCHYLEENLYQVTFPSGLRLSLLCQHLVTYLHHHVMQKDLLSLTALTDLTDLIKLTGLTDLSILILSISIRLMMAAMIMIMIVTL